MDVERIIDDIEQLQKMFEAPDIRPLSASDISAEIEGTTKCSPIALGFGCGSILACAAVPNPGDPIAGIDAAKRRERPCPQHIQIEAG